MGILGGVTGFQPVRRHYDDALRAHLFIYKMHNLKQTTEKLHFLRRTKSLTLYSGFLLPELSFEPRGSLT
jgi:hypothetical protein